MTLEDGLNAFRVMMILGSGVTEELGDTFFMHKPMSSALFKPYRSVGDGFFRAATVLTAPITCSMLCLDFALHTLFYAVKSLSDLLLVSKEEAMQSLLKAYDALQHVLIFGVYALASPIVNLVDLIGGGINSIIERHHDSAAPPCSK